MEVFDIRAGGIPMHRLEDGSASANNGRWSDMGEAVVLLGHDCLVFHFSVEGLGLFIIFFIFFMISLILPITDCFFYVHSSYVIDFTSITICSLTYCLFCILYYIT
jgi:hypothetical protein